MFPGMTPDQIKQRLLESVRAGTDDAVIPEIGTPPSSNLTRSSTSLRRHSLRAASCRCSSMDLRRLTRRIKSLSC